jgi:hypothetical protein
MAKEVVKLEINVMAETAQDIDDLFREQGWDTTEGLQILLGMGLGAVRGEQVHSKGEEAKERMAAWLIEVEGSLAVLRSRMYEMEKANQSWELSTGAIRKQNIGFIGLINRVKEEINELKKVNLSQQDEIRSLRSQLDTRADQPVQPDQNSNQTGERKSWVRMKGK